MSPLDPDRWKAISPYLDQALEMPEGERATWLAALRAEDPALAADLQKLLDQEHSLERHRFLEESPTLPAGPTLDFRLQGSGGSAEYPKRKKQEDGPARGSAIGRFLVIDRLGSGGMGLVLAAYDPELDRKVAIKLLRPGVFADAGRGRARLQREAQAMAKLAHPNVVTVYETGTSGDQVFVAMEHVDGETLGAWCGAQRRRWREILEAYLHAGRGLAAAHALGLVHRDFKPENVLVGRDGRVRVSDFGLVGTAGDESVGAVAHESPALTQAGAVMGTPSYMAPEQHQGLPADARADQFAFCVSLWEALSGAHPFGKTGEERRQRLLTGQPPGAGAGTMPAWVGAALRRGMQVDPAARFPSMEALLAALDLGVRRRRALWIAGATGGALTLASAVVIVATSAGRGPAPPCQGAAERLVGVWDTPMKEATRAAFVATGRPGATDTYARVAARLDRRAADWAAMRQETCEATEVRKEQSAQLLDLRMVCLDRRLGELRALTAMFARGPGPEGVDRAVAAVDELPPLATCTDAEALLATVPLPADPETRARVAAAGARVREADALRAAGKLRESLPIAEAAVADAEKIDYAPARAEALYTLARVRQELGDGPIRETWERALQEASVARDDALAARIWAGLIASTSKPADALALRLGAEAMVARAGNDVVARAQLQLALAGSHRFAGELDEALAKAEQALAALTNAGTELERVSALEEIARILGRKGAYADAYARYQEVLAVRERVLGSEHPDVAEVLGYLCEIAGQLSRFAEARAHCDRGVQLAERLGATSDRYATALHNQAMLAGRTGRWEEAIRLFRRSIELREELAGPEDKMIGFLLISLGAAEVETGEHAAAAKDLVRAARIIEKQLGAETTAMASVVYNTGWLRLAEGKTAVARAEFERARALFEKKLGPDHPVLSNTLTGLGMACIAERRPADALPLLERALEMRLRDEDAFGVAETRFELARALLDLGRDRDRARELARQAAEQYASIPDGWVKKREMIEAWRAAHP